MYFISKQQEDGSFNIPSGNGTTKHTIYASLNEAIDTAKTYAANNNAKYVVFKAVAKAQPTTPPVEVISL